MKWTVDILGVFHGALEIERISGSQELVAGRQCLSPTTDEEKNTGTLQGRVRQSRAESRQRPLLAARRQNSPSEGSVIGRAFTKEDLRK